MMNGFLVLNKPEGVTSFKAASSFRRIFSEKKTGHTGTLDPMATGVLPVALGKATRFIDCLPDCGKAYRARFRLGTVTDTLDITGTVLRRCETSAGYDEIKEVLPLFTGEIEQLPPMYSAVSVNGVRLYKLARQGIEVEREKRLVTVSSVELADLGDGEFQLDVSCSKGTYIRTIIADIGEKLGCGAVMTALCRTASDGFTIDMAHTPEEAEALGEKAVMKIDEVFSFCPEISVTAGQTVRFSNGGELSADRLNTELSAGLYRVYSPEKKFLGLGEVKAEDVSVLKAKKVMGNDI